MQLNKDSSSKIMSGNVTIITLVSVFLISILFISLTDLIRIYNTREEVKNATDAASLAVAQKLLFFETQDLEDEATRIIGANGCDFVELFIDYDEVSVVAAKKVDHIFIGRIFKKTSLIYCTSKVKITFPWDETLGKCKSLRFDF
jgi:uncharacterized membrane protein